MSVQDLEFVAWYAGLHGRLANSLLVISGDPESAADAADEAFARALARWGRVRVMQNRDGWVYRVAVNDLRRRARRAARERERLRVAPSAPDAGASEPVSSVWKAVAQLSPRQREAVVLRYLADFDEAHIARVMGVSRSTVSTALTRAHRQLAERLVSDEEESHG